MCHPRRRRLCTDISLPRSEFDLERERIERLWNEEMPAHERRERYAAAEGEAKLLHADIWTRRRAGLDLPD